MVRTRLSGREGHEYVGGRILLPPTWYFMVHGPVRRVNNDSFVFIRRPLNTSSARDPRFLLPYDLMRGPGLPSPSPKRCLGQLSFESHTRPGHYLTGVLDKGAAKLSSRTASCAAAIAVVILLRIANTRAVEAFVCRHYRSPAAAASAQLTPPTYRVWKPFPDPDGHGPSTVIGMRHVSRGHLLTSELQLDGKHLRKLGSKM